MSGNSSHCTAPPSDSHRCSAIWASGASNAPFSPWPGGWSGLDESLALAAVITTLCACVGSVYGGAMSGVNVPKCGPDTDARRRGRPELSRSCCHPVERIRSQTARVRVNSDAAMAAKHIQITSATVTASTAARVVGVGAGTCAPLWSTQISTGSPASTVDGALTAPVCSVPAADHRAGTVIVRGAARLVGRQGRR